MKIKIYQVDAFTDVVFGGNPASVCPLDTWLDDQQLQKIAIENNQNMTAFFVRQSNGSYQMRWFNVKGETPFCGHATLASAYVIFHYLDPSVQQITFHTKAGALHVARDGVYIVLNFPVIIAEPCSSNKILDAIFRGISFQAFVNHDYFYMAVLNSEKEVQQFQPPMDEIEKLDARGLVITAPGENVDFVSRRFALPYGEDPVTGSAHCMLMPYWSQRLNKTKLIAEQISQRRGKLWCELKDERVFLSSQAVLYLEGEIYI